MKRIYKSVVIILILGLFAHCSSTVEKKIETKKEIAPCQFLTNVNNKFSFRDSISKVLIVSYQFLREYDTSDIAFETNLVVNKKIGFNKFKEQIFLNNIQIDSVEKILLNYSSINQDTLLTPECYNPRHCIYFFNSQKEVLHYFEICFECIQTRSDKSDELSIYCHSQFEHLKKFFKQCGIKEKLEKN